MEAKITELFNVIGEAVKSRDLRIEQLERELAASARDFNACRDALDRSVAKLSAEKALADRLDNALKPFASYIDKGTCKIKMIWEDGSYTSTYTDTLKPADFFSASDARAAYLKVRGL